MIISLKPLLTAFVNFQLGYDGKYRLLIKKRSSNDSQHYFRICCLSSNSVFSRYQNNPDTEVHGTHSSEDYLDTEQEQEHSFNPLSLDKTINEGEGMEGGALGKKECLKVLFLIFHLSVGHKLKLSPLFFFPFRKCI